MSPVRWEHQALDSIQSVLGHTDPKLASLLATFTRLAASEEMPAHEKVRSPLGHPPRRHPPRRHRSRPRRGKAPHRDRSLQQAVILIWLITSIAMITRGDSQPRRSSPMSPGIWYVRRLGVRPTVTRARDLLLRARFVVGLRCSAARVRPGDMRYSRAAPVGRVIQLFDGARADVRHLGPSVGWRRCSGGNGSGLRRAQAACRGD
jgi:hypothetical protein